MNVVGNYWCSCAVKQSHTKHPSGYMMCDYCGGLIEMSKEVNNNKTLRISGVAAMSRGIEAAVNLCLECVVQLQGIEKAKEMVKRMGYEKEVKETEVK